MRKISEIVFIFYGELNLITLTTRQRERKANKYLKCKEIFTRFQAKFSERKTKLSEHQNMKNSFSEKKERRKWNEIVRVLCAQTKMELIDRGRVRKSDKA